MSETKPVGKDTLHDSNSDLSDPSWRTHQVFPGVELAVRRCTQKEIQNRHMMRAFGVQGAALAVSVLTGSNDGALDYSPLGAPRWVRVDGFVGVSISHTRGANRDGIVVATAALTPVGIDIERRSRGVSLISRKLDEHEQALLDRYDAIELFCAKEAAGKASGVGLAGSITRWQVREMNGILTVHDAETGDKWVVKSPQREYLQREYLQRDDLQRDDLQQSERLIGEQEFACAVAIPAASEGS